MDDKVEKVETDCEPLSPIPQFDGSSSGYTFYPEYNLLFEAHEQYTDDDIVKAIKNNLYGTLDDKKVDKKDKVRYLLVEKIDTLSNLPAFKIIVKEEKLARDIIESWKTRYEFDELAFANAVYGKISIKIGEVKRLR